MSYPRRVSVAKYFNFINTNIGVLSGRLLSMEGVIKTFILFDGAFVEALTSKADEGVS